MIRYICLQIILLISAFSIAQTTTQNYVKEIVYKSGRNSSGLYLLTKSDFITTTYYDGLGRPIQQVQQQASPVDDKNIITHIEYEKNVGQTKNYLPFTVTGGSSTYVADAKQKTLDFYTTYNEYTENPYSETRSEKSPNSRVLETGAPGYVWSIGIKEGYGISEDERNTIRYQYGFNSASEVKKFDVTSSWNVAREVYTNTILQNGFYPVNTLKKTTTKNENWELTNGKNNTTDEFTGTDGKVLLKRSYNNNISYDTYYVYDFYGNLAYVIPPLANGSISGNNLDNLCYQYLYDEKNRLVEKKLPQKQREYIVYDKANRVVLTGPVQNPFNASASTGWLITKYDNQSRSVYTGFYNGHTVTAENRKAIKAAIYAQTDNNESKSSSNVSIDGVTTRYTNTKFPTAFNLLTVNYYDDYQFPNAPVPLPTVQGVTPVAKVKGLATGSWVRVISTTTERKADVSYTLYNNKYQSIRTYVTNYLGGYVQTDHVLTFRGLPTQTITTQKKDVTATALAVSNHYTYDHRERLKTHTQQLNNGESKTIVENVYDELGVLTTKKVGGNSTTPLQKVDYKYNIRGWLTDINNADMYAPGNEVKLFNFKINYNGMDYISRGKRLYNGNINSVLWRTQTDGINKGYLFNYDHLNRMEKAQMMEYQSGWTMSFVANEKNNEVLSYDKNGNIVTLNRTGELVNGQPIEIDDLTYIYSANQLQSVTDATNNTEGFNDGNKTGVDYTYDVFGNLKTDKNKKITNITYNHLNLPTEITFATGKITYTYDATGNKLKKVVQPTSGVAQTTDYLYGFQYLNGVLQFFPHAEGYVKQTATNSYLYVYQYKDHLGNVRLSYADCDGNGTINPATEILEENNYYPFGLQHQGYNDIANSCRNEEAEAYKLNGKEYEDSFGLNIYEMDLRQLDPAIGRWVVQDPVVHHEFSPYSAFDNNPVYWSDPSGADAIQRGGNFYFSGDDARKFFEEYGKVLDDKQSTEEQAQSMYEFDAGATQGGGGGNGNGDPKKKKGQSAKYNNTAFSSAMGASVILIGDDVTGIGVADDVLIPVIWGGAVGVWLYDNKALLEKQLVEIGRIIDKQLQPSGFMYELRVNKSGNYIDVRGNKVYLNAGDTWKYGETSKGSSRYSRSTLDKMVPGGVNMNILFMGNQSEIKVQEKIMIYWYAIQNGGLPPGNKIFR